MSFWNKIMIRKLLKDIKKRKYFITTFQKWNKQDQFRLNKLLKKERDEDVNSNIRT